MIETVLFAAVLLLNLWGARHFRNSARTVNARETGDTP